MENVLTIEAKEKDVGVLLELAKTTFYETFSKDNAPGATEAYIAENFTYDKLLAELKNENSKFYIAYNNGLASGYLKLNFKQAQTELKDDEAMEIERIYILSNYQGSGMGRQLYNVATEAALSAGVKYMWLGVWERNAKAIRFYEGLGFKVFSRHIFKMGDEEQVDYMMRKDV